MKKKKEQCVSVKIDDSLEKALTLMNHHKINHLGIFCYDGCEGLVSKEMIVDLLSKIPTIKSDQSVTQTFQEITMIDFVGLPLPFFSSENNLEEIFSALINDRRGAILIKENGRIAGILTKTDVLFVLIKCLRKIEQVEFSRLFKSELMSHAKGMGHK